MSAPANDETALLERCSTGIAGTGNPGLDAMGGGGLAYGASTLLVGPFGVGKTTTAMSCVSCLHAMSGSKALLMQMHELLQYLNENSVATILVLSQHGIFGEEKNDVDLGYLSDSILLFRYFEARGSLRKALSFAKSRTFRHETSIREFRLDSQGLALGEALKDFEGVMREGAAYRGLTRCWARSKAFDHRQADSMHRHVLVLAPRGRAFDVKSQVLGSRGFGAISCNELIDLVTGFDKGAAAAIVTDDVFAQEPDRCLVDWLKGQPPWSDFPFIVLTTRRPRYGNPAALGLLGALGNVVLLERPVNAETLGLSVSAALAGQGQAGPVQPAGDGQTRRQPVRDGAVEPGHQCQGCHA